MEACSLPLVIGYHNNNGWWLNHSDRNESDTEVTLLSITYQEEGKNRKYLYSIEYWRRTNEVESGESARESERRETLDGDSIDFIPQFLEKNGLLKESATN
jgi:hypothetical protein